MEAKSESVHLPLWSDLWSEMIERCIEKKKATEDFSDTDIRYDSEDSTGKENKLKYPVLNETTIMNLNDLLDVIVTMAFIEINNAKPLEFQTDRNTPLETLVTRLNDIRRRDLEHMEAAINAALENQTSSDKTLRDIKRWLEVLSIRENSRPEIAYIQTVVYTLLKRILIIHGKRQHETLDIEVMLKTSFRKDIKPELKRLVTMVSAQLQLQGSIYSVDIRQKIRYMKESIDVNLERIDDRLCSNLIEEKIYVDIGPVLEYIDAKFGVGKEIENIKYALFTIVKKNEIEIDVHIQQKKQTIRFIIENIYTMVNDQQLLRSIYDTKNELLARPRVKLLFGQKPLEKAFDTIEAILEKHITMIYNEKRQIYDAIDAMGEIINTWADARQKIQRVHGRHTIRHIFDTLETMLEKSYSGIDTQLEKQQVSDATETILEKINMGFDVQQKIKQIKDAIDPTLKHINKLVGAMGEIHIVHKRTLCNDTILHKILSEYYSRKENNTMLEHFDIVLDTLQNVQRFYPDVKNMVDRMGMALDSRYQILLINENVNTILEKIVTTINARQKIPYISRACDSSSSLSFDERQCLLDIQIILDKMLETFFNNERQIARNTRALEYEEQKLHGFLTAVDILLNPIAPRAQVRHKPELKAVQNVVYKMIESVAPKRNELQDIQNALRIMLHRIVTMVNYRRTFNIARVEACGSMAEHTSVWKHDVKTGKPYTESDFLAILDYSSAIQAGNSCRGLCVEVGELPTFSTKLTTKTADELKSEAFSELKARSGERVMLDRLFWKELHSCFGSACDCFTVEFDEMNPWYRVSYKSLASCQTEHQPLCSKCVVEMPTGILKVNDSVSIGGIEEANCSLVFVWTSKAKTLLTCDKFLIKEPQQINSLPVHVDFLPVLEVLKPGPDETAHEHDYFLVPKHCNVCDRKENWRKSNCMTEISFINNEMSEKHRKCYKIMKYCLAAAVDKHCVDINWYHVKTVALNHSRGCSDTSEGCGDCVLKMLTELKHAYETKTLNSFHEPEVNMIGPYYQSSYTNTCVSVLERFIERLCSVTETASLSTFLEPM